MNVDEADWEYEEITLEKVSVLFSVLASFPCQILSLARRA